MTDEYDEMLDAAIDKLGDHVTRVFIETLADHAARQVELEVEEHEINTPGDRIVETYWTAVPAQDEITIDATAYVEAGIDDYGNGTHVHSSPVSGLCRVNVSSPQVFVVDAQGSRIEGGRIMVTYTNVEIDTP